MADRLRASTSPYLLQHVANPVDWWPWGPEAFAVAEERDVPVFVSIGYATCHWCHVMSRETFSDPRIAALLDEGFVAIKVDREEHPDVDSAYLTAASAFTRDLGWPLSVFTTPDGRAFFAGTYFPPEPRGGIPSFTEVLDAVQDAWTHRRDDVADTAGRVAAAVDAMRGRGRDGASGSGTITADRLRSAATALAAAEDPEYGGFAQAPQFAGPKFPAVPALGFLLGGEEETRTAGLHTLRAMAGSPLRDPVDGGFFRYGTRRDWGEPHYERMLYDNAGLLRLYAEAAADEAEGSGGAEGIGAGWAGPVAEGIARFLLTTLRVSGGLASAQDSESEVDGIRREGVYYRLDPAERSKQPAPSLDAKVLTGWNGLGIGALAHAGALLGHAEWVAAAARIADGLLADHVSADGRMLVRASLDGRASGASAALEDYGLFARGLLEVFLATGEPRFALAARTLVDASLDAAGADAASPYAVPFEVPGGGDAVLRAHGIVADADPSEGAYPSGLSALADAARVLYALTDHERYDRAARVAIGTVAELAPGNPLAFGGVLRVASALASDLVQLVVVVPGGTVAAETSAVTARRARALGQHAVGVAVGEATASELAASGFGLFEARGAIDGRATEYLCRAFVCELPHAFEV